MEQAVGRLVSYEVHIEKDDVVSGKILGYSRGFVESYRQLGDPKLAPFCRQFSASNGLSFRSSGIFLGKNRCSALFFKPFLPPKIRNYQKNLTAETQRLYKGRKVSLRAVSSIDHQKIIPVFR